MSAPCPYHSTIENGMRHYRPRHECFTVYDEPTSPDGGQR